MSTEENQHASVECDQAIRFTDRAAARAFECGIEHSKVLHALASGHFKQPAVEYHRFVHYVRVDGRPVKVVTAPNHVDPDTTAIIEVHRLD
jgi:hypothetical protein